MIYRLRRRLAVPRRWEQWESHFSRQIAGWTDADWAAAADLRWRLYEAGVTLKAGDARWTPGEASTVGQAVGNIAQAFGEPVSRIVGGAIIRRTRTSRWPLGFAGRRCYGWEGLGVVRLNDSAFAAPGRAERVLMHELGHYFQESCNLIDAFLRATGGHQFNWLGIAQLNLTPYRCGGQAPAAWCEESGVYEDFAGSFETFVFHQIGRPHPSNVLDSTRACFFQEVGHSHRA